MFTTYLRRELSNRRKQTSIVAIGLAVAIALVILVNSFAVGIRTAQASALESVYGVGTDITVTSAPTGPGEGGGGAPGERFEFGADDQAATDSGTTEVSQSRLSTGMGASTFAATSLDSILSVSGVSQAIGVLSLTNTTFNGEMPDMSSSTGEAPAAPGAGAQPGAGGSSFDIESFTVLGLDPAQSASGPLAEATIESGRTLEASDAGSNVVVLDSSYATTAGLAVDSTIDVGGTQMTVIGIVASSGSDATTAANVYLPLDVAQSISGETDMLSSVYVTAASADNIEQVTTDIEAVLPDATVSTQADLAASVSGSLSTASSLVAGLGTWLSVLVLAVAFLIAVLFTVSGVARRTREFGTLKAIGWSNRQVLRQVVGESLVQGLIGGVLGIALGLGGIAIVNLIAPTLTTGTAAADGAGEGMPAGGPGGDATGGAPGGMPGQVVQTATDIVLNLPVNVPMIGLAVGLAVAGGLVAGAIGGWRASRLRPAEALRSIA